MTQLALMYRWIPSTLGGIDASLTDPKLQSPFYAELVSKLSWAVGSTYGVPYSSARSVACMLAREFASSIIAEHGYGGGIRR